MSVIYKKTFTRDLAMIIVELYARALDNVFKRMYGYTLSDPTFIFNTKDMVIEEWENKEFNKLFSDKIVEMNNKDSKFLELGIKLYQEQLIVMNDLTTKGYADSLTNFKLYVDSLLKALEGFVIFYFTASDVRNPKDLRQRAQNIRDSDVLGEESDKAIRNTLSKIFPQAKGYATVVSTEDIDNMPSEKLLKQRWDDSIYIPGIYSACESLEKFSKSHPQYEFLHEKPTSKDLKEGTISGNIAFKGYAKGKVRVLKRKDQVSELKEGEILVSPMTTPDFLPAMEKSAAIVTEEGGITCHAAIVARELKKPCIIGTKVATQVFKTGDIVEVDADKGVVRKI